MSMKFSWSKISITIHLKNKKPVINPSFEMFEGQLEMWNSKKTGQQFAEADV